MRIKKLTNITNENITVTLLGGPQITLPPNASLDNADITDVQSLQGKVQIIEDLTEVSLPSGKKRLLG